jgi:hypothetical protein
LDSSRNGISKSSITSHVALAKRGPKTFNLAPENSEPTEILFRIKAAQRLQSCGRLCGCSLVAHSRGVDAQNTPLQNHRIFDAWRMVWNR